MKVTINIPESLSEISLAQYQKWLKISDKNEDDNLFKLGITAKMDKEHALKALDSADKAFNNGTGYWPTMKV